MKVIIVTLGVILQMQCSQQVNFVESPSNISLPVGSVAEFRCQHQSIDAVISWLVNGSSAARFPDVSQNNSGNVGTLTIPSVPEYNETMVVCGAFYRSNGSPLFEQTLPAILTVLSIESFLTVPSPQVLIVTMEERHVYMCNHSETVNVFWRVNGSRLRVDIFPVGILTEDIEFLPPGGGRVSTLTIGGHLEHNATTIQCSAQLADGSAVTTPNVSFFMQGSLQRVINLERRNVTIVWEAPFSLNLTNVEPNIVYYVEVYNITCGGRELLISDCDVTETSYTSDVIAPDGYIYEYIVTPSSNVEGAQDGTSKKVTEQFMDLQLSTRHLSFSFIKIESGDDIEELKTRIRLNNQDQKQIFSVDATSYSLLLSPLDGLKEESLLVSTTAVRNGSSVLLTVSLPYRRLWNYTVLAYDCEEHPLLEMSELNTHDIQNISVTSPQPGEVRVTGDFIEGSTATGLLTIVISTSEIFYHLIKRGSDQLHIEGSIQGVVGGEHSISFFVVEESGLPFSRTASIPKHVSVEYDNDVNQPSIEYSLQSTSTGVCITCTFLDESITECLTVVHQRVNSKSLNIINSTHKLTRSGDTASGCIEGVNMEDYQVGVVSGRRLSSHTTKAKDPSSSSCEGCIAGAVLGVVVFIFILLLVVVIVSLIVVRKQRKTKLNQIDVETGGATSRQSSADYENESSVNVHYESIHPQGSRAEAFGSRQPLLSSSHSLRPRPEENREQSLSSSPSSQDSSRDTLSTNLSSPSGSSDGHILGEPMYDQPQPPGSTDVQPRSNEEGSPPPVPPKTEASKILVDESTNPSPSPQDTDSTDTQSASDPTYDEPQLPGSALVQSPCNENSNQALQASPPVPPRTKESAILLEASSGSLPSQDIAGLTNQLPAPDPTYDELQQPQSTLKQLRGSEKQVSASEYSSGGPTYALPVLPTPSGITSPPVADSVVYDDINGFQNSEGQQYAMLGEMSTSERTPDDLTKTVYSEIKPHSRGSTTAAVGVEPDTSSDKNTADTTAETHTSTDPPFTIENIFPHLLSLASKWQAVGEALSLDEDRLDEIFTNNENDEACLRVMLEFYMKRCGLKHSWEEIRQAISKVEEKDRETKGIDSSSQESLGKKPLDAEINDGRVTGEHGPPPAVPPHAPPHIPTGVESASHNNMTTADSTTEECPAPKHVQPHMTCGQPHNDSSDAVVDLEVDTELKENECREHQQVQNNEGKEEEAAEEESGDNKNTVINIEHLRGTAEIQVSHTHTPPSDFSPQPFDDNKDECKEHQFPLSFQETQHDEADYKTELMKTLLKENKICQENLSRLNLGQSKTHEAERALSPLESPSPSMVDSQNTKCYSIFYQYGGIVKKISVHCQVTIIEVCNPSQTSCICVYVIFSH